MSYFSFEMTLGAAFIVFYSYGRFNTPPTNRASTTALRYHFGATVYTVTIMAIYTVLAGIRPLAERHYSDTEMPALLKELSDPLLAALMLTVLLPNTPWLSEVDRLLRKRTQRLAAIPFEVRRVSQELRRRPIEIPPELRQQTRRELLIQGLTESDILFEPSDVPQHTWTKIGALMTQLSSWSSDHRFASFTLGFAQEWESLQREYGRLSRRGAWAFRFARQASEQADDRRSREMAAENLANFHEDAKEMLGQLYEFIAHAVLDCELTLAARDQRLAQLGFRRSQKPPADPDVLVGVFLLLLFVTVTILGLAAQFAPQRAIQIGIMISTSYLLAVISSLTVRARRIRKAQRRGRPWATYLLSGLAAVGAASLLSLVYRFVVTLANPHEWSDTGASGLLAQTATQFTSVGAPWLLVAFSTAFVVAFHLDNKPTPRLEERSLRVVEAATQAAATGFAGFGAWWFLGTHAPPLPRVLLLSMTLGCLIGSIVPAAYRSTKENELPDSPPRETVNVVAGATS